MEFNPIAYPRSLQNMLMNRVSIMSDLEQKLATAKQLETKLYDELVKLAPEELKQFLDTSGMLDTLFKYGQCQEKISFNDEGQGFGFTNFTDVKKKLKKLAKAWNEVVKIDIEKPEGDEETGRVSVWFRPYN